MALKADKYVSKIPKKVMELNAEGNTAYGYDADRLLKKMTSGKSVVVKLNVDKWVKREAEGYLEACGVELCVALRCFLHRVVLMKGLPFPKQYLESGYKHIQE